MNSSLGIKPEFRIDKSEVDSFSQSIFVMNKFIGIDISKLSFDVAYFHDEKYVNGQYQNNEKGFKALLKKFSINNHYVMEASGPYYLPLACYLAKQGCKVSVVNPLQIRRYSQMRLIRAKTDKKDAQVIAEFAEINGVKEWKMPESNLVKIQQVITAIEGINKQQHLTNRQMESFIASGVLDEQIKQSLKSILTNLFKQKNKLETRLDELLQEKYSDNIKRVQTIPGIGKKTAAMLCVITHNFTKFDNYKQLIAYVGFSPRIFQSGTSARGKGHICKMGKSQIRKLLYLCSWSAKRYNKTCIEMYQRLIQKGKPERVVKIAIANKLLKLAFAIATNKTEYNENYSSKKLVF